MSPPTSHEAEHHDAPPLSTKRQVVDAVIDFTGGIMG